MTLYFTDRTHILAHRLQLIGSPDAQRVLAVLIRDTCVSLSVSNPYLNLATPLGAVMLRDGKLPQRSFTRLLDACKDELAGTVLGVP